jgi:hypothetical protein
MENNKPAEWPQQGETEMYTTTSRYDADGCLIITCTSESGNVSMTYDGVEYELRGHANKEMQEQMRIECMAAYDKE